jgi:hypothetical protein
MAANQAAAAANQAAALAAQVPLPPAAPAFAFALSPALTNAANIIDYSTPTGAKLFTASTKKLAKEFDLKPEGLKLFLTQISDRARTAGWKEIFDIPVVLGANPLLTHNLIQKYGVVTLAQVRAHSETYHATQSRMA